MNREQDSFLNFGGGTFLWTGVVEDRFDPLKAGRIRVRIFGLHNEDRTELPTDCLPWASVVLPVTEAGSSGIGDAIPSNVEGSWVIGFFRDGAACQDPVVLGSLPGISPPDWQNGANTAKVGIVDGNTGGSSGSTTTSGSVPFTSLEETGNSIKTDSMALFNDPLSVSMQNIKTEMSQELRVDPNKKIEDAYPEFIKTTNQENFEKAVADFEANPGTSAEWLAKTKSRGSVAPVNAEEVPEFLAGAPESVKQEVNSIIAAIDKSLTTKVHEEVSNSIERTLNTNVSSSTFGSISDFSSEKLQNSVLSELQNNSLIFRVIDNPSETIQNEIIDKTYNDLLGKTITPIIDQITSSIIDPFSALTTGVGSPLSAVTEDLLGDISKGISDFTTGIGEELTSISKGVMSINISNTLFSDSVENTIDSISDLGTDILNNALDEVRNTIEGTISSVIGDSVSMLESAFGAILAPLQMVGETFEQVVAISDLLKNSDTPLTEIFSDGMSQFKLEYFLDGNETINIFTDTGKAAFENLKADVRTSFQDLRRGIVNDLEGIGHSLSKKPISKFPIYPSESDVNRVARTHESVLKPGGMKYNYDKRKDPNWIEPDMDYASVYPYNHYKETESGHIMEFDDTPDHERLQIRHRSGTGFHVNPDGTIKNEIQGDSFSVYMRDNKLHVYGDIEVYGDTNANISIFGEANIKIGGDAKISVGGNCSLDVEHQIDMRANCDVSISSGRNLILAAENEVVIQAKNKGQRTKWCKGQGKAIDLEAGRAGVQILSDDGSMLIAAEKKMEIDSNEYIKMDSDAEIQLNSKGIMDLWSDEMIRFNTFKIASIDFPESFGFGNAPNVLSPAFPVTHPALAFEDDIEGYSSDSSYSSNGLAIAKEEYKSKLRTGAKNGQVSSPALINRRNDTAIPSEPPAEIPQRSFSGSDKSRNIELDKDISLRNKNHPIYSTQISDFFYLSDFTWDPLVQQGQYVISRFGVSEEEIIKNLSHLAVTLDPVAREYGGPSFSSHGRKPGRLQVTSGFRHNSGQGSKHSTGRAVDLQVVGLPSSKMFDFAVNVEKILSSNGGYERILLEFASRTNRPWIHVEAFRNSAQGNVFTVRDDTIFESGFINYSSKYYA